MRKITIFGLLMTIGVGPACGQAVNPPSAPALAQNTPPAVSQPGPAKPAPVSTSDLLSSAVLSNSTEPTFDSGTYARLKEALLSYTSLQVRGGWPALPADAKLAAGSTGPTVALLRQRLVITEDLASDKERGDTYDGVVEEGVKHFQLRHGLEATGSVGPQTLAALNVPVKKRLQQLAASLD